MSDQKVNKQIPEKISEIKRRVRLEANSAIQAGRKAKMKELGHGFNLNAKHNEQANKEKSERMQGIKQGPDRAKKAIETKSQPGGSYDLKKQEKRFAVMEKINYSGLKILSEINDVFELYCPIHEYKFEKSFDALKNYDKKFRQPEFYDFCPCCKPLRKNGP